MSPDIKPQRISGLKLWLSILVAFLTVQIIYSQEICNNGIDDDSDGLVDINDPDCECEDVQVSMITGYFEEMTCCPMNFTNPLEPGIACLVNWSQATNGTTDYHNTCGYTGGVLNPYMPEPPPSGNGAVGFITRDGYQEYVGRCLPSPMLAGETYTVEMYVGFNEGPFPPFSYESNSPFEIGIFGTTSCANYPANTSNCISFLAEWDLIGAQSASGNFGEWTYINFMITPTQDYAAIAIGGSCNASSQDSQYHFIDDLIITGNFEGGDPPEINIELTGDCVNGIELDISDFPGASYQWYLDGIAIPGATQIPHPVTPGENGTYNVLVDFGNDCAISNEIEVTIDTDVLDVTGEVFDVSCTTGNDGTIQLDLPTTNEPISVLWDSGETTATIDGLTSGNYTVTITDANGCTGEQTFIVFEPDDGLEGQILNVTHPAFPETTGMAEIDITGGTPGYTYLWDNGETTPLATMLSPGQHFVTVTDMNGCEIIIEVTINPVLEINFNIQNAPCNGACEGLIELAVAGGMPLYEYFLERWRLKRYKFKPLLRVLFSDCY